MPVDGTAGGGAGGAGGTVKATSAADAAIQMAYANQVIVVPGYGLAVAQAQHAVKEMAALLEAKGCRGQSTRSLRLPAVCPAT